jgi:peptidoglycan/xylan/chitin deacetylase (PgdA/CDA1 family)
MRRWVSFRQGRGALPRKPILLTFDDGRLDSYRGADQVLAREHMRAAMFVITGQVDRKNPFYLSWDELHRMHDSGRWDIEPHAHDGHTEVTISASGQRAPFYAARRFTRSRGLESLGAWEARVDTDLFTLERQFAEHGFRPDAFAVPYSDYGQGRTNDSAIAGLLSALLKRQFGSYFVQADDGDAAFSAPGIGAVDRYEVRTDTTLDDLYGWLRRHSQQEMS